jgi:hypothetical protein
LGIRDGGSKKEVASSFRNRIRDFVFFHGIANRPHFPKKIR